MSNVISISANLATNKHGVLAFVANASHLAGKPYDHPTLYPDQHRAKLAAKQQRAHPAVRKVWKSAMFVPSPVL